MLDITIPGYKQMHLHHLVLDFNGTLACDGSLLVGVKPLLHGRIVILNAVFHQPALYRSPGEASTASA